MRGRSVLVNSTWLIADKVVRLGLGLLFWVWFARRFGPESFGLWNFAIAFAAIFGVFAALGLDGIVVKELSRSEAGEGVVLGTAFGLRLLAGIAMLAAAAGAVILTRGTDTSATWLVIMNAGVFLIQSVQVIEQYFQVRMNSRPAVISANAAFVFAMLLRLVMLWNDAGLRWFGLSLLVEAAFAAVLLYTAYRRDSESRTCWRFDFDMAAVLVRQSWPLMLSGVAVVIYMRLDQVMLSAMLGNAAVGQFSAALRIAEVWYFIPLAIVTASFPVMMKKRDEGREAYIKYVQRLYDGMAWLGIGVAVVLTLTAEVIVSRLYGPEFSQAASVLSVQIWAGIAVSMSFVHGKWLLAEGLQRYNLLYTVTGMVINLTLNLFLIPKYGPVGAAWATLVTQVFPIFMQVFLRDCRQNFFLMARALVAPFRLVGWIQ